jgi:DNA repair photolyase
MSASRSAALRRPPVSPLSAPVGVPSEVAVDRDRRRGRGAITNASGRYEPLARIAFDDGWQNLEDLPPFKTTVTVDATRKIITRNDSPDISFDRSINPYRGCEHGCIYCFARPTHAYLGLSPGLDFETRILFKPDAAKLLTAELASPKYRPDVVAMGTNTDPYQPVERDLKITRSIIRVLSDFNNPVGIVTKNHLVTRDIDILGDMAKRNLAEVFLSVTTLDKELARDMEPRASAPHRRLDAIKALADAGVPVGVMTAPMIPGLNDHEMEAILEKAAEAGATRAGFTVLRLPLEIKDLFDEWLRANRPDRAEKVLSLIRQMRGGALYQAEFGTRMKGEGPIAQLLGARFQAAVKRLGLNRIRYRLDTLRFAVPDSARTALVDAKRDARQMKLL